MKKFQLIIGCILLILGIWLGYSSFNMPTYSTEGLLLGQSSVFVLWGIREIIGGVL
jgi:hypothetical protein